MYFGNNWSGEEWKGNVQTLLRTGHYYAGIGYEYNYDTHDGNVKTYDTETGNPQMWDFYAYFNGAGCGVSFCEHIGGTVLPPTDEFSLLKQGR